MTCQVVNWLYSCCPRGLISNIRAGSCWFSISGSTVLQSTVCSAVKFDVNIYYYQNRYASKDYSIAYWCNITIQALQRCSMMLFLIRDKTESTGTKQGHFFLCPVLSICVPVLSQHLSVMLLVDPVLSIIVPVWSLDVRVWTMRLCFPSVQPGVRMG